MPRRRAMLFMPGDDLRKISKGAGLAVDSLIMDWEDGVAPTNKTQARQITREALHSLDFGESEKLIRINPSGSPWQAEDLSALADMALDGVVIPKVENAESLRQIDKALRERLPLFAIIESARGVANLHEIASSSARLVGLMFGAEDLTGSLGGVRRPHAPEINYGRSAVLIHARAADLQAIDTPYVDIHNLEGLAEETHASLNMGYDGKLCIHPKHVPVIHEIYMPNAEQIEKAQALINAHTAQQESGQGVFVFEGKMVDMPMIRAAQAILRRAGISD